MEAAREMWTDDRIDEFSRRVDGRFDQVDKRLDRFEDKMEVRLGGIETRLDGIQQSIIYAVVAFVGAAIAGFVAIIGLIFTQL
jgi:hypothetical protein